ncbi:YicC family protein [bacterium]|nr:YicC family protein [FCB group bacterium]MBL7190415.1 YicC family protein [bacterium]
MKPVRSMTGFGRESAVNGDSHLVSEVKSVNNRYLELSVKLPRSFGRFEHEAREIIAKYIDRGKIYVNITEMGVSSRLENLKLDIEFFRASHKDLQRICDELGIEENVKLEHILNLLLNSKDESLVSADEKLEELARTALMKSLQRLDEMRIIEGGHLKQDLEQRLKEIEEAVNKIEELSADNARRRLEKINERIISLSRMKEIDPYRMELEAVFLADKVDITEEIVRLRSHIIKFRDLLYEGSPCGRKLNFLIQEINRELNTAASKSDLFEISHFVVDMKEELEKIREQVQNVE